MPDIEITARSVKTVYAHAEPIVLNLVIVNTCPGDVFIAPGRVTATKTSDASMRVMLGQPEPEPGLIVDLYDFRVPRLETIPGGGKWSGDIKVPMPLTEPEEDATGTVQAVEAKLSGSVKLQLDVGYGVTPLSSGTNTIEGYLAWQRVQNAAPIAIEIKAP